METWKEEVLMSERGKKLEAMIAAEAAERKRKAEEARLAEIEAQNKKREQQFKGLGQFIQAEEIQTPAGQRGQLRQRIRNRGR